jgi:hypothetical protein
VSEKLSPERLAEIAARVEAATPGPWIECDDPWNGKPLLYAGDRAHMYENQVIGMTDYEPDTERGYIASDADATFIAASRTDIPALLAHIAAVEAERDALAAKGVEHIHSFRYNCALLVHNGTGTSVEWQFLSICETCGEPRRLPIRDEEAPK